MSERSNISSRIAGFYKKTLAQRRAQMAEIGLSVPRIGEIGWPAAVAVWTPALPTA